MENLLKECVVDVVQAAASAGTSTLTTSVVDMAGYDAATFLCMTGDVTATSVLTLTVKGNTANSTSSPTPVTVKATDALTAGANDTDSKIIAVNVNRPAYRYLFAELTRATANAVVNNIVCIRYKARTLPVTQSSDVVASAQSTPN